MVKSYFQNSTDLIGWRENADCNPIVEPWKPRALCHDEWPPNYRGVYAWRIQQLERLRADPVLLASAKAYYRTRPAEFIQHWVDTYDPRRTGKKWVPFVFFTKQAHLIEFIEDCINDSESGLIEKCRDFGATWLLCAFSVHQWLFVSDDAIGWGSRKQELVDKIGDASSIFEKMRLIVRRLPDIWKPLGLKERDHLSFMKLINPENGSAITGETGDNIGRGGRTKMYLKDESAHYERPEKIEAALGDNTNIQIDISSVNGLGNPFHRRRKNGVDWRPGLAIAPGFVRVFVADWRDHPEKTQEWYDARKAKAAREGMLHIFAQEVDRNYSAAISNTIIDLVWITSAIDAHKRIKWKDDNGNVRIGLNDNDIGNKWIGGLDVADDGIDRNALALRQGIILRDIDEWGERDPGVSTRRAMQAARVHRGIEVQYDSIGIGASVKAEYNRLVDIKEIIPSEMMFVPWNAGAAVQNPYHNVIPDDKESTLNKDFFQNFKAQAWWSLRTRFFKTWNNIVNGVIYPIDEMISIDSTIKLLNRLCEELAQPTIDKSSLSLKMVVEKKPDGEKSPNLGDATVMAFFPAITNTPIIVGGYGV